MDGFVTPSDITFWLNDLRLALPADANLDDVVDGVDFLIWNDHRFTATSGWCSADFDMDGIVDGTDFLIWNEYKFTSAVVVPEPAFLSLCWVAVLVAGFARACHYPSCRSDRSSAPSPPMVVF